MPFSTTGPSGPIGVAGWGGFVRNRIVGYAAMALALGCVGCASGGYKSVDAASPSAEVTFSKGHRSQWSVSGSQTYSIYSDDCATLTPAATLLWTTGNSRTVRAPAGRRLVVLAATTYFADDTENKVSVAPVETYRTTTICDGAVSFVTEAGHAYEVSQKAPLGAACPIFVTDKATDAPPASLRFTDSPNCVAHHKD